MGTVPNYDYQVAPWQTWEIAASGLPFEIEKHIIKRLNIAVDEDSMNLYTRDAALFFFMWEEWDPWFHYTDTDPQLLTAHVLIMQEVCIFYILFTLISIF
jgi:hypothetical protein